MNGSLPVCTDTDTERSVASLVSSQYIHKSENWNSGEHTTIVSPVTSCQSPAIGGRKLEEGGVVKRFGVGGWKGTERRGGVENDGRAGHGEGEWYGGTVR